MADSIEDAAVVFEELGDLEREFAEIELDARTQRYRLKYHLLLR